MSDAPRADRKVRLCMIGAGQHSSLNIYPYFHFLEETAELAANCDLDLARARKVGRRFGIEHSYDDHRKMIAEQKPDGVMICIGDTQHAQLAIELMALGVHVYVEKPHAPSLDHSKKMLAASVEHRRICMAAYKKRFSPAYQKARAAIESPEFGKPTYLSLARSKGWSGEQTPGYVWHWGCHVTNLIGYLFGQAKTVHTLKSPDSWSAVICSIQFTNGAVGSLRFCAPGRTAEELVAVGEARHGVQVIDSIYYTGFYGSEPVAGHWPNFITGNTQSSVEEGFVPEMREFVNAIAEGRQPDSHIVHSTWTSALHEALMRSAETGRTEDVEQFDPGVLPVPAAIA